MAQILSSVQIILLGSASLLKKLVSLVFLLHSLLCTKKYNALQKANL